MKILIKGEHNFFLFQDLVYYFLLFLKGKWKLPINNNYEIGTCSYYICDSWYDLLLIKLYKSQKTELSKELINKLTEWMVTTNIAILRAQKETKTRNIDRYDEEYLKKYKPFFLIEHIDNFKNYVVNIDGDIKILFLNAIDFNKSFFKNDYKVLLAEIIKLFEVEETEISKELNVVINDFTADSFIKDELESYEILEE